MPGPIIRRCRYAQKSPPQSPTANRLARCSQSVMVPIGNRSQAICGPIVPVMVTVGTALMEIRENRLYRSEFKTFEEYCQSKWGFSRQFANKTIESSGIASGLETIVSISNGATAEQFVKVFCADHPQVSVCPKKAATITHSGSAGDRRQSITATTGNRSQAIYGPVSGVLTNQTIPLNRAVRLLRLKGNSP